MPSTEGWRWCKHYAVASSFAYVGGYADVISLKRWNCFATMTTGNTIWLGRVLLGNDPAHNELHGPHFYLAIIAAFYLGVVLHRCADLRWPNRGGSKVGPPLALVCFACEALLLGLRCPWDGMQWLIVLYSPLFGAICGACADGRLGSATTMVSGHVINLGKATANARTRQLSSVEKLKLGLSCFVIAFSVLGAFTGSVAYRRAAPRWEAGLLLPICPLLMVLFWFHDHLARPRRLVKRFQSALRKAGHRSADDEATEESTGSDSSDDEEATEEGDLDVVEPVPQARTARASEPGSQRSGAGGERAWMHADA